jgi:AcrR family transcriptional regulator
MFVKRRSRATDDQEPPRRVPPRRVPTQERARQRVERVLDAAALVFAESGYETATMEEIAARAGTSIGSIYQFFPNKLAIFEEIARRYHDKLRVFFDVMVASPLFERPMGEIIDAAIEAVWAFHESEPAFRAVWVGLGFTEEVLVEGEALNREFARRIEAVVAKKLPGLPAKSRPIVATMIVEVLTAMLIVSTRRGKTESRAIKAETKTLLNRYLAPYEVRSQR